MVTRSHDLNIIFYFQPELNGDYRLQLRQHQLICVVILVKMSSGLVTS